MGIDFRQARERVQFYVENYRMEVQLDKRVTDISVGEAQRVEIIKTLYRGADILILDEPTAVLTPQESGKLFEILKYLRHDNKSVIFISHKLQEVMEVSDRITVMRGGRHIATVNQSQTSISELAVMMVGREVFLQVERERPIGGDVLLAVQNIYVTGEKEQSKLRGVSLEVRTGEIVGVAGVAGNGQGELVEALTGLRTIEKGEVYFRGQPIQNLSPLRIRALGIAHIPEDRNIRGLNRSFTINENLVANRFFRRPYSKLLNLNQKEISRYTKKLISAFSIRPADGNASAAALSGGNAQKTVVAREVDVKAPLLIASQPTRGVDVGSTELIRNVLNNVKKSEAAVLLVSADLEEILSLADRIVVMYEGRIVGIVRGDEATEETVGLLMTGGDQ
jgi:simple sugar transport system ATP-binding protein